MNKVLLCSASLSVLLASTPLLASPSISSALAECRIEQNSLKRLACYDEISITSSTDITLNGVAASIAKEAPETEFGREHRQTSDQTLDKIYAVVSKISSNSRKQLIVTFDNGQVWRQTEGATYQINVGERHFIKRGMLGAFYLGNDSNNRTLKVKRED